MQTNDDNPLRRFIKDIDPERNWPKNYRSSPIYQRGHQTGYNRGYETAWEEANRVIDTIRSVITLHDEKNSDQV